MSLISGPEKGSRAIKRIKIRPRLMTNPEQYLSTKRPTSKKIGTVMSLINDEQQKTSPSRQFAQTRDNYFTTQKSSSYHEKNTNRSEKIHTQANEKSRGVSQRILKNDKKNDILARAKPQPYVKRQNTNNVDNHKAQKRIEENQNLHMNYREYEEIINRAELSPSYFQNIAKRNDEKLVIRDQFLRKDHFSFNNIDKTKRTNYQSQKGRALPALGKNTKIKLLRGNDEGSTSMKTILGCNLGALSNLQIKEKLQEKWINEQKQSIQKNNNNTLVFTQQSQMVSEIDTKQQTMRQQFFLRDQRKRKIKMPDKKEEIDWNTIANQKFKQALRKILELKQSNSFGGKGSGEEFSFGNEYGQKQQQLLAPYSIYRPKQFIMKHKLEWKL